MNDEETEMVYGLILLCLLASLVILLLTRI